MRNIIETQKTSLLKGADGLFNVTPGLNKTNPNSEGTFGRNLIAPPAKPSYSNSMYDLSKSVADSPNRMKSFESRGEENLLTTLKRQNYSP